MINNRFRVINSNDAFEALLKLERGLPWLIDVLSGEVFEDGNPFADIITVLVLRLEERDRRIDYPVLMKEC